MENPGTAWERREATTAQSLKLVGTTEMAAKKCRNTIPTTRHQGLKGQISRQAGCFQHGHLSTLMSITQFPRLSPCSSDHHPILTVISLFCGHLPILWLLPGHRIISLLPHKQRSHFPPWCGCSPHQGHGETRD